MGVARVEDEFADLEDGYSYIETFTLKKFDSGWQVEKK